MVRTVRFSFSCLRKVRKFLLFRFKNYIYMLWWLKMIKNRRGGINNGNCDIVFPLLIKLNEAETLHIFRSYLLPLSECQRQKMSGSKIVTHKNANKKKKIRGEQVKNRRPLSVLAWAAFFFFFFCAELQKVEFFSYQFTIRIATTISVYILANNVYALSSRQWHAAPYYVWLLHR